MKTALFKPKMTVLLGCLLVLLLITVLLTYYVTITHKADARLIDIAGRQRLLSQKMIKEALMLISVRETKSSANEDLRNALVNTVALFDSSLIALRDGGSTPGTDGDEVNLPESSKEIKLQFEKVTGIWRPMNDLIAIILDPTEDVNSIKVSQAITSLQDNSISLLNESNKAVVLLKEAAEKKETIVSSVQITAFFLIILIAFISLYFSNTLRTSNAQLKLTVAKRKEAEDALEQHLKELERSNNELKQFAYIASHDLQEPLRMVSNFTQLLADRYKGKLDCDADEFIAYAVGGAERMQALIDDLLDYSRATIQKKDLEPSDVNIFFKQALVNLKISIEENDAKVNTYGPFPTVIAYGPQLTRLFQNLINNAIKYRSERPPEIDIGVKPYGDEWLFYVKDNGIGIDPAYKDCIFNIFRRLHGQDEYSGTGIGLSICKKIVECHNGRIWVDSEEGKGSTFYFTIPKAAEDHDKKTRVKSDETGATLPL